MIKASLLWLKQSKHPSESHRKTQTGCLSLSEIERERGRQMGSKGLLGKQKEK